MTQAEALLKTIHTLTANYPQGVGYLNLVVRGGVNLPEEVRSKVMNALEAFAPFNLATAHIVYLDGMPGVMVRTIISAMMLATGAKRTTTRVFATFDEGAPWILEGLKRGNSDQPWSLIELREIYQTVADSIQLAA